jgi:hypothetical protein
MNVLCVPAFQFTSTWIQSYKTSECDSQALLHVTEIRTSTFILFCLFRRRLGKVGGGGGREATFPSRQRLSDSPWLHISNKIIREIFVKFGNFFTKRCTANVKIGAVSHALLQRLNENQRVNYISDRFTWNWVLKITRLPRWAVVTVKIDAMKAKFQRRA